MGPQIRSLRQHHWTQTFASQTALNDVAYGVVADPQNGGIVVSGFTAIANNTADVWIRRYTSGGTPTWTQTYNGTQDMDDVGYAIAMNAQGFIYVAGLETVNGPLGSAWLRKLAP